jgi:hypothetical protein
VEVIVSEHQGTFRRWAAQWRGADERRRALVVFRPQGTTERIRAQAREIYNDAASQAGPGGMVIVSVGHGGSGSREGLAGDSSVGMVDLAPRLALRLQRENVLYGEQREHDEVTIREYRRIGQDRCRRLGRRRSRLPTEQAFDLAYCDGAPSASERLEIREAYEAIGASFRGHRVAEVVLLTCRVGDATAFLDRIALDWGVRVTAYRRRVAGGRDSEGQYRVYLLGDDEGEGTNRERARTQIPNRDRYTASARSEGN